MTAQLPFYDDFISKIRDSPVWPEEKEKILLEPFDYLAAVPGKELRSALLDAFNLWLGVNSEDVEIIKKVVGMLHTASLLMDDVEDGSQLRRGLPVAHKIYGVPQTINTANYVYFLALQHLQKVSFGSKVQIDKLVNEELLNLHRGQGMDLYWREHLVCPTEQEYIQMVNNKTGGLFRVAVRLMMAASPDTGDYVPLANLIGIIYQIRDDYINLQDAKYSESKGYCEDFTEGKFSFPIVHSIRADTNNHQILNILRERTTDNDVKAYAVSYINEKTKSFEYTRAVLDKLMQQAVAETERLGSNEAVQKILSKLVITTNV